MHKVPANDNSGTFVRLSVATAMVIDKIRLGLPIETRKVRK